MILRRGNKGEAVKRLQRALIASGQDLQPDGDFGRLTETAVKNFQRQHGLAADGVVGPRTLAALELHAGTPPSGAGTGAAPAREITFSLEDTEAPPVVKARIREFASGLEQTHDTAIGRMQDALANFETTMVFASSREAQPDVLGSVLGVVLEFAVDHVVDAAAETVAPWLRRAKAAVTKTREEIERAAWAAASHSVGQWIRAKRTAIGNMRGTLRTEDLKTDLELEYLEAGNRDAYFDGLSASVERLRTASPATVQDLERRLYERWISANELMRRATGFQTPLDLRVRKCVSFY